MAKLRFSYRYLLLPAVLSIFFVSLYLVYEDIKGRTVNEFNNEQLILARTASQGITTTFENYQSDLLFLARQNELIDLSDNGRSLIADFYNTHKGIVAAITRVDARGVILYTYPINQSVIGSDISYQKHVQQVIATRQTVISDVFMAAQGYLAIAIHVPIFRNNDYAGSLAILIPIDELGKLYLGNITIRGTGSVWLISESGIEIYCKEKEHTGKSFLENTRDDPRTVQLLEKISSVNSGTTKGIHREVTVDGKNVFNEKYINFFRTTLGNTYWTILISYEERDVYVALTRFRNRLALVVLLLFIAVSYYFYSLAKVRNVLNEEAKRKEAEKVLKESEEKFRRIFEDHTAVKMLVDPDSGKIIDANKAASEFYGWSREELKKMSVMQLNTLPPKEVRENLEKVRAEQKMHFELRHLLKDGSVRDVELFSSKIEIGGKSLLHSIIHDITDRKLAEDELIKSKEKAEESDRLKTAFLQNMSHEIRTPMNAIVGFSSLLPETFDNKHKLHEYSEIINSSCDNLLEIINDILDISRIESGQLRVNPGACNLTGLFTELTEYFREYQERLGKKHIRLHLSAPGKQADNAIITDRVKLRQILINLIGNAFKFTDSGKIEGGCRFDGKGNIEFYVSDTGIGIPPDKHDVIFERFAQLDMGTNKLTSGTGLGLSIVKGLVELMKGTIWLESEVGKGTTFYFSFPCEKDKSGPSQPAADDDSQTYNFQGKSILVVEDDSVNAAYIKAILFGSGLKMTYASSGGEAVRIAITEPVDLVLMDIRLPDMSGYEALNLIRQKKPGLIIIAQTAYASNDDRQRVSDAGFTDYISKPMKRNALLKMISKHLGR